MVRLFFFRVFLIAIPWAGAILIDKFVYMTVHPDRPWNFKKAVIFFGIGIFLILWLMSLRDPHFFDFP